MSTIFILCKGEEILTDLQSMNQLSEEIHEVHEFCRIETDEKVLHQRWNEVGDTGSCWG